MDEKRDRDPFENRYNRDEESKSSKTEKTAETKNTSKMSKTEKQSKKVKSEKSSSTVKDRKNVNMYLANEMVEDLQLRYSELNVEYRREYNEDMPKNDVFYPAVVKAALEGTTVEEQLEL